MASRHAHACVYIWTHTCTHSGHDWRLKILFFPFKILNGTAVDPYLFIYLPGESQTFQHIYLCFIPFNSSKGRGD